jgi:5-methylcytosine-specific restriction protein A
MTARTHTPCRRTGCPELTNTGTGFCAVHKSAGSWDKHGTRGNRHAQGYGTAWTKLRQRILRRDNGICQLCKADGVITVATTVDHIVPKAERGTDAPHNLRSLCKSHHASKTAAEGRAGKAL